MKQHKGLKILCCILAAILLTAGICVIVANSQNDHSAPTAQLSQWQSMIKDDALLKNIVIPGAHDAGTAGLVYLAETQDRNTAQLLECGTRYLDLRVTDDGELKIFHGPFKGVTLQSVLDAVKTFLQSNPTEAVILDFQHFGNDAQNKTLDMLLKTLQPFIVPADTADCEFVDTLTLGQVRGKCVVFWGDGYDQIANNFVLKRNNDEGTRANSAMQSYYESKLNKKSSKAYIQQALPHYIDLYKQQNSGMFVLQGQLTDGLLLRGPHLREATHNKNMNAYVQDLANSADLQYINIVLRDYCSPRKNCLAIQLNLNKGLVETSKTELFRQMIAENI